MTQYDIIREMQTEIRRLKQELAKRPIKASSAASTAVKTILIIGGNTLSDAVTAGIKHVSSTPVPAAVYDPDVDTTFVDGIGVGTLYSDNVLVRKVLVGHYTGNGSGLTTALWANSLVLSTAATVTLDVPSVPGQQITLYVPLTR